MALTVVRGLLARGDTDEPTIRSTTSALPSQRSGPR